MSYLAVQIIQIHYTDDQRGSADAEKRQRIRALPFVPVAGDGVLHDCRVNAWESFEPKTTTSPLLLRNGELLVGNSPEPLQTMQRPSPPQVGRASGDGLLFTLHLTIQLDNHMVRCKPTR